jgi:hypothetical protein
VPTGCVLADEERIATVAESLIGDEGPKIEKQVALDAVARLEERLVASLTATQQEVAIGPGQWAPPRCRRGRGRVREDDNVGGSPRRFRENRLHRARHRDLRTGPAKNLGDGTGIDSRSVTHLATGPQHPGDLGPARADPR